MHVREATESDAEAIREVAETSLGASYTLPPSAIVAAVEEWYGDDTFAGKLADDDRLYLVAEAEVEAEAEGQSQGQVAAFSESEVVADQGDILWLHVAPLHRGKGIGVELFEETWGALEDRGVEAVRGMVLADNEEGNEFYEAQGLEQAGEREVEIDARSYRENVYVSEDTVELQTVTTDDGEVYVDRGESIRGDEGVFHVVYTDRDRETKWGYFCDNCETLVTSMSAMGAMECVECGNVSKPTRWDAAYM